MYTEMTDVDLNLGSLRWAGPCGAFVYYVENFSFRDILCIDTSNSMDIFFSFCCCIIIIVPFLRFMFMWYLKAHSSSKCALCYYFFKSSWNCGNAAILLVIRIIIVQFSRLLAPKNMETLRQKAATSNNACLIRT